MCRREMEETQGPFQTKSRRQFLINSDKVNKILLKKKKRKRKAL